MSSEWHGFRRTFRDMVAYVAWKRINALHAERRRKKQYKRNWYPPVTQDETYHKVMRTLRVFTRFIAEHGELRITGFGTFRVVPNRWPARPRWDHKRHRLIRRRARSHRIVFYPDENLIRVLNS